MGYLLSAWKETQKTFTMPLKQSVNMAGTGELADEESMNELREFFSLIDLTIMKRFLSECISKDKKYKFDAKPFAFQDLVNEMGRRLGYSVSFGLYRGKRDENGYDGLWVSKDGNYIIVEVKTSDDYSIKIDTVTGYRDQLIVDRKVPKKKCSILYVYGRDDKNALRNTVKGSDEAKNIRIISADALFQLVRINSETPSTTITKQIDSILRPKDYYLLDNLVELVFPQTDDEIPDIEEDDTENENTTNVKDDKPNKTRVQQDNSTNTAFEIVADKPPKGVTILRMAGNVVKASGYYLGDKPFVVLKGSEMRKTITPSCRSAIIKNRDKLIELGYVKDGIFVHSVRFNSPTTAAECVYGGTQNGRIRWIE